MKNDFQTNSIPLKKQEFMKRNNGIFGIAIFLTGIETLAGIWTIITAIIKGGKLFANAFFMSHIVFYISIICIFISLVQMAINEKPFSKIFSQCMVIIGIIVCIASFVLPRLSDYHSSGIEILSMGKFVFCDGMYLTLGLLFLILGRLIKMGFEMQKEMDSIL